MEKLFSVNELKKTKVQKKYFKTSKGAMITSLGMAVTFFVFTIAFSIYGFGIKNSFLVRDVTASDYGKKDLFFVWAVLIAVDIIILFLWVIQKMVVFIIYGKYIGQRINESLTISTDAIEYGYQNLVGSTASDRVIVRVPVDSIRRIEIDTKIDRVEICGLVSSKYYENYARRKTRAPKNNYKEGSLVLFDYFEPGLIEFFNENYAETVEMK